MAVVETHPIQYHAPVYCTLQQRFGIPVTAIYGSDFSVAGYLDPEFGTSFSWDTDLLSGYACVFLSRVARGGARHVGQVSGRGIGRALRRVRPRAVMVLGYRPRFHRKAFFAALRAGLPVLFRGEATDHTVRRARVWRWARDLFLRRFYARCSVVLYVGRRALAHYRRLGVPETKLVFSPYCVDNSVFRSDEAARARLRDMCRAELGVPARSLVLLFSGKLVPKKAPELILEAVKRLNCDEARRPVVVFLGDGPQRQRLLERAKAEPPVSVRFVGFRNQSELSRYYHAADLLVLPSRFGETWGLVVNEALHHGVPCVVSDAVGCAPDLVEPGVTGEVFEAGSADGLADALLRAFRLVDRPEVRARCREKVAGYSVERAAAGIAEAFHRVTASTPEVPAAAR